MNETKSEAIRTYLLLGLGALAVLGLMQFNASGGSPLTVIVLLPALLGLLFRYVSAPPFFLILLTWQSVFPSMIPFGNVSTIILSRSHFRIEPLLSLGCALVYLIAQYRLNSLKSRVFPADGAEGSRSQKPRTRQASDFRTEELFPAGFVVLLVLLAASFVWLLIASYKINPMEIPPFVARRTGENDFDPRSQFLILIGAVGVPLFAVGFGFRYASWLKRSPTWGRQYLLDTAWLENRRELNRQEKRRDDALRRLSHSNAEPEPRRKRKPLSLLALLKVGGCVVIAVLVAAVAVFALMVVIIAVVRRTA